MGDLLQILISKRHGDLLEFLAFLEYHRVIDLIELD